MEKSWPIIMFLSVAFAVLMTCVIPHRIEVHMVDSVSRPDLERLVGQLQARFDAYDSNFTKIQNIINGKVGTLPQTPTPTKR